MKRQSGSFSTWVIIAACVLVVIGAAVILARRGGAAAREQSKEVEETIAFLGDLEKGDPQDVRDALSSRKKNQRLAEREQNRQALIDGTIDVWSLFTDYAIIGDSRAEGFIDYGFLSEDRVLAVKGEGIDNTEAWIPKLQALNPSVIFIVYGTNDMGNGVGAGWDGYKEHCRPHLQALKQAFPNADIYFNSIMPVYDPAYSKNGVWAEIDLYNGVLRDLCAEEDIYFIDTNEVAAQNMGMYMEDGIHFISEFYEIWARNMWLQVYDMSYTEEDAAAGNEKETFLDGLTETGGTEEAQTGTETEDTWAANADYAGL